MSTHERRTAKSRCFASSCEEVPTENSICGSSLGTFSFAQSPISADKKVGVGALSFGVRRPLLVRTNEGSIAPVPSSPARVLGDHPRRMLHWSLPKWADERQNSALLHDAFFRSGTKIQRICRQG